MDNFKITLSVREKYLAHIAQYFEVEEEIIKKWSKVGKGLDYYTFKSWVSKDNRFTVTTKSYPRNPMNGESYYHDLNSVLFKLNQNSYETQLHVYEMLCLLVLVDKKKLSNRLEYLKWAESCMALELSDCKVIRENILIDFQLDFNSVELDEFKKKSIFLQGVKLAFVSDKVIDHHEKHFLKELSNRLGLSEIRGNYHFYLNYLTENILEKKCAFNKVAAFLLHLIGCDEDIHENEVKWFKDFFGPVDMTSVRPLMSLNMKDLIENLEPQLQCLTYLLSLELSLSDDEIHANERFWLTEIQDVIPRNFKMDRDLYCIYLSIVEKNFSFVKNYSEFFKFIDDKFDGDRKVAFKEWSLSQVLIGKKVKSKTLYSYLFNDELTISKNDQIDFLMNFSKTVIEFKKNLNIVENYKNLSKTIFSDVVEDYYSELLICELLKISLIDNHIEECEDDFVRALQYKFNIPESSIDRVVFYTSFLLGKNIFLSARLNYAQL
jgi:hypothetical protein